MIKALSKDRPQYLRTNTSHPNRCTRNKNRHNKTVKKLQFRGNLKNKTNKSTEENPGKRRANGAMPETESETANRKGEEE